MRKYFTFIFLVLGLSFITGVSADQSPESIVTCSTGNAYDVGALSIAGAPCTRIHALRALLLWKIKGAR